MYNISIMSRPPKYDTPEAMAEDLEVYFTKCEVDKEFPTITGLAMALDMSTEALRMYQEKDAFLATIKRAKQRVELAWEQRLLAPGSGPIFWLKNNAGWRDKTESEITAKVTGVIILPEKKEQ